MDRTFIDIIDLNQFQCKLKSLHSQVKNVFCENDMEEINFNGFRFIAVIRKGTKEFFQ